MPDPDPNRRAELFHELCDDFELSWQSGKPRDLESLLRDWDEPERTQLFRELLVIDIRYRRMKGDPPDRDTYLERFRTFRDIIESVFAGLAAVDPESASMRTNQIAKTNDLEKNLPGSNPSKAPAKIGRYDVKSVLGSGAFGCVYLGYDDDLKRNIAIKIPRPDRVSTPALVELFLHEAQMIARLEHPAITPVFDLGKMPDGQCYVVSKYIDGFDLAQKLQTDRPTMEESANLMATLAEALHTAHQEKIIHRDIKPANILLDSTGQPFVTDFGIALREERFGKDGAFVGTPAYMSPEQARHEGHLVDGRSDIFSLGIVFYELLTGERPFVGDTTEEIMERIQKVDARPPRQIASRISPELERICLKCLEKRVGDRYTTALDLAVDLRMYLSSEDHTEEALKRQATSHNRPRVIPKGLRSFDEGDADFFLQLLPGPRDREGIPESIRFWKRRMETSDPNNSFRIGVIYGPSGCGKSSFVKAGLLPRLAKEINVCYVECHSGQTEARWKHRLRQIAPDFSSNDLELDEMVTAIRTKGQQNCLIVLDQFEQWMLDHRDFEGQPLVKALRQCDGRQLRCLILIRDDFWLGVHRLSKELDITLSVDKNFAVIDLMDEVDARHILTEFGRAYNQLPDHEDLSEEQNRMFDQVIAGISESEKIAPVHLVLFVEMIKGKPWTAETLKSIGGVKGVGVSFLNETIDKSTTPSIRVHRSAMRRILHAMLPDAHLAIRGPMRSRSELIEASGYAGQPEAFDEMMQLMDSELRLVTPSEVEISPDQDQLHTSPGGPYWQLTHDFLVESIRNWLNQHQRRTRRGRAELLLIERVAAWSSASTSRNLPTMWESLRIACLSDRSRWDRMQSKMMGIAAAYYGRRFVAVLLIFVLIMLSARTLQKRQLAKRHIEELPTVRFENVPEKIEQIHDVIYWAKPQLEAILSSRNQDQDVLPARERNSYSDPKNEDALRVRMALLRHDSNHLEPIVNELLVADVEHLEVLTRFLSPYASSLTTRLSGILKDEKDSKSRRFRAACALIQFPTFETDRLDESSIAELITEQQIKEIARAPVDTHQWIDLLANAKGILVETLVRVYNDEQEIEFDRISAAVLANYLSDDRQRLADLLLDANPRQFEIIFSRLSPHNDVPQIIQDRMHLAQVTAAVDGGRLAVRQVANGAFALFLLGHADAASNVFAFSDMPDARTELIHLMNEIEVESDVLLDRLQLSHENPGEMQAMLLLLSESNSKHIRSVATPIVLEIFENDPDPGVHAAAERLLRKWGQAERILNIESRLSQHPAGDRSWYITTAPHHTMVVLGPAEFTMGTARGERFKQVGDDQHARVLPRRIAISDKEVTIAQFQDFMRDYGEQDWKELADYLEESSPDIPFTFVTWQQAARFCNWLSHKEGFDKQEWCYEESGGIIRCATDYLDRTGYRLPTEAEWEYACRGGTTTTWFFGESEIYLGSFAWYLKTSSDRLSPVGLLWPNAFGMFDMLGNSREWCNDYYQHYANQKIITDSSITATKQPHSSAIRVVRGGFYSDPAQRVRPAMRFYVEEGKANITRGFRIARTMD